MSITNELLELRNFEEKIRNMCYSVSDDMYGNVEMVSKIDQYTTTLTEYIKECKITLTKFLGGFFVMAKKKKCDLGLIATFVAVLLGVVAVIMMFVPSVAVIDSDTVYKGTDMVFGLKTTEPIIGEVIYFEFSFMNLLTYILAIVGVVFTVLAFLGKGSKFAMLIATIAFVLAGIFFLLQVAFCVPGKDLEEFINGLGSFFGEEKSVKDSLKLGAGSIVGAICSFLSAIACVYKLLAK